MVTSVRTVGGRRERYGRMSVVPDELARFLTEWLGAWPDHDGLTVVGSPLRSVPGWDGTVRDVVGVAAPGRAVISVPVRYAGNVRDTVKTWDDLAALPGTLGRTGDPWYAGTFRWTLTPTDLPDAGEWIDVHDPRVPEWLRPFGDKALIALAGGEYAAGVGIKRHNLAGMELSVGTDEAHRGKGLASRLVAQASRWVLAQHAVPIYLHDPANTASDRTARAAGYPDLGWKILGMPPRSGGPL